jgi:hypothetical protein
MNKLDTFRFLKLASPLTFKVEFRVVGPSIWTSLKKEALLETFREDFKRVGPSTWTVFKKEAFMEALSDAR